MPQLYTSSSATRSWLRHRLCRHFASVCIDSGLHRHIPALLYSISICASMTPQKQTAKRQAIAQPLYSHCFSGIVISCAPGIEKFIPIREGYNMLHTIFAVTISKPTAVFFRRLCNPVKCILFSGSIILTKRRVFSISTSSSPCRTAFLTALEKYGNCLS